MRCSRSKSGEAVERTEAGGAGEVSARSRGFRQGFRRGLWRNWTVKVPSEQQCPRTSENKGAGPAPGLCGA